MKLLVIVQSGMFDACLSLLRELKHKVDLYCLFEEHIYRPNMIGVNMCDFNGRSIIPFQEIESLKRFRDYLPVQQSKIVSVASAKNVAQLIKSFISINSYIDEIKPNYIYFYNIPSIMYLPFLFKTKIWWCMAIHDPIPHSSESGKKLMSYRYSIFIKKCRKCFIFSESLIDDLIEKYSLSKYRLYTTKLGPYEHLKMYQTDILPHIGLNVLFFGRIEKYKGLRYLLKAFKELLEEGVLDINLTIAGKGYIEENILDLKSTQGLFIYNTFIDDKDLSNLIQNCDLVICPYTDASQSGVIMSAFAFCKPVIATNVGGLPEMVKDGEYGKIISPSSSESIKEVLKTIKSNTSQIDKWQRNIRRDFFDGESSWKSISDKLLSDIGINR